MSKSSYLIKQFSALLILSLLALGIWKHEAIADWIKLKSYHASLTISQLVRDDGMTASAKQLFYINRPLLISDNAEFAQDCPQLEQTIVLGCYQSGENGIFLRQVTDQRLSGVEQVTAAHEMLHGAYERLSQSEKNSVDSLLLNYYKTDLHDARIISTIASYRKTEPNDVVNEMHSIFGTEVARLPAPLEKYYLRYFNDRSLVTKFASGYEAEFTNRLAKIKAYEAQLQILKNQISNQEAQLNSQLTQIQADRQSLENLRHSGQVNEYNSRVSGFNQEIQAYNAGVERLKSSIAYYNSIVELHNQLADELRGLYTSLGTNISIQSAQ